MRGKTSSFMLRSIIGKYSDINNIHNKYIQLSQFVFSQYCFKYWIRTWWLRSREPSDWGWNVVDFNCLILKMRQNVAITSLIKLLPWSVWIARGHPNREMNCSARAIAIAVDSVFLRGMASEYLVRLSCIVKIYLLPFSVSGNGPTRSI